LGVVNEISSLGYQYYYRWTLTDVRLYVAKNYTSKDWLSSRGTAHHKSPNPLWIRTLDKTASYQGCLDLRPFEQRSWQTSEDHRTTPVKFKQLHTL